MALDCTAGAGTAPTLLGIEALKRKGGTLLIQGETGDFPNIPLAKVANKYITIKAARGHNYQSCELVVAAIELGAFQSGFDHNPSFWAGRYGQGNQSRRW